MAFRKWYRASVRKTQTFCETAFINITGEKKEAFLLSAHTKIISSSSCCLCVNYDCEFILVKVHPTLQQGMTAHRSLHWQASAPNLPQCSAGLQTLLWDWLCPRTFSQENVVSPPAYFYIPAFYLQVSPSRGIVPNDPLSWETSHCRRK